MLRREIVGGRVLPCCLVREVDGLERNASRSLWQLRFHDSSRDLTIHLITWVDEP